jgi:serine/threonine protein kinase
VDFGLARQQQSDVLTTIGRTVGTPAYMAPELVRGERTLDRRIDVWALGVILYELLTLRRPFVAPTREGVWRAILETTPADPRTHVPSLPHALCDVVAVALSPEPDRRYATALDLGSGLAARARWRTDPREASERARSHDLVRAAQSSRVGARVVIDRDAGERARLRRCDEPRLARTQARIGRGPRRPPRVL